jgi:AcrR family transcriptional regulator
MSVDYKKFVCGACEREGHLVKACSPDAAAELTQQQGFERTTMAEVAHQAGVGTGTLYRHFPDKRALLLELFDLWSERVVADRAGDLRTESLMREDPREFLAV